MNNNPVETQSIQAPKTRRALGRGLRDILADQIQWDDQFNELPEHVKAARIGAAILELVDSVEARYQPVIFQSVAAYRAVAHADSTEEIGRKLAELEYLRIQRQNIKPKRKRRWYYLFLR